MSTAEPMELWSRALLEPGQPSRGTQAIRRAFLVLRVVALGRENGCGLSEVSDACGLARPTVRRILMALMAEGAVEQSRRTMRYRAPGYLQILELLPQNVPFMRQANLLLDEAAEEIGDNVSLTVRSGLETVCVARRLGSYPIQVLSLGIGVRRPIGTSSSSIAILSTMPEREAMQILAENEGRFADDGVTLAEIMANVERARACGYAFRERGLVRGTRALSIAIRSLDEPAYATLTVTAIARRIPPQRVNTIVEVLRSCATKMSGLIALDAEPT